MPLDPASILELLDDRPAHGDAPDLFDVTARDGLTVSDDRKRFHHGSRVLRRLFGVEAIQVLAHLRPALESPAARQRHQVRRPALANRGPIHRAVRVPCLRRARRQTACACRATGRGCCAQISAVSRTRFASCVFMDSCSHPSPSIHGGSNLADGSAAMARHVSEQSVATLQPKMAFRNPPGAGIVAPPARFAYLLDLHHRPGSTRSVEPTQEDSRNHCSEGEGLMSVLAICPHARGRSAGNGASKSSRRPLPDAPGRAGPHATPALTTPAPAPRHRAHRRPVDARATRGAHGSDACARCAKCIEAR